MIFNDVSCFPRRLFLSVLMILSTLVAGVAAAQTFPAKPIHFVVAGPAGQATDLLARLLAEKMSPRLKQPIIVDNKVGAAGIIGTEFVAKAPPDGHTILIGQSGPIVINPYLYKLNFDPQKDLAPVTLLSNGATFMVIRADSPINSIDEFIAEARKVPGKLSFASYGAGSLSHLMGESFKGAAGVNLLHVPYKASPMLDIISGRIDIIFEAGPSALPLINGGKIKALGVLSPQRLAIMPNLPTMGERLPTFNPKGFIGVFVPAGTPPAIISSLHAEFVQALATSEVRKRLSDGIARPGGLSPAEFGTYVKSASDEYGAMIKELNIKAE